MSYPRLKVTPHLGLAALGKAANAEPHGRIRTRILAIRLLVQGYSPVQVAQVLACSANQVRRWLHLYNAQGLAGLRDRARSGRPPTLTAAQLELFKERVRQAGDGAGATAVRIADLQLLLAAGVGGHYSRSGIYWLVHRLGLARAVPRPPSPRQDHAARDTATQPGAALPQPP